MSKEWLQLTVSMVSAKQINTEMFSCSMITWNLTWFFNQLQNIYQILFACKNDLIWVFQREEWGAKRGRRVRDRVGDRVKEGGPSCLSPLRWIRHSSLSSPLLTWPQLLKIKQEWAGETVEIGGEENERHTFSSPSFKSLWWPWQGDIDFLLLVWLWPSV